MGYYWGLRAPQGAKFCILTAFSLYLSANFMHCSILQRELWWNSMTTPRESR